MGFRFECWTLEVASLPRIWRYCPQCAHAIAFVCSERFRVNAQKKALDVWLLYRCSVCELTWKLPILARCNVAMIDTRLRDAFECNDSVTARRYACDASTLNGHVIIADPSEIRVSRVQAERRELRADTIRLELRGPCVMRLDRLLSRELRVSREELHRRHADNRIVIVPARADALARKVRNGQEIRLLDGLGDCVPTL